ncbi:hypothetical protein ISF_02009 [Cordyceps fumosorosea ARSEF 2679]|uniref:Uncharacterized protein n=1 Tax=Cordyceps fumosorosea (strain ARSEF 2679) TaxID=1081104 RepID=A0A168CJM9_CORFA|nr:hypothetical protein ISF_02009 [Cordyceps fumosorosea ARSEF 2679]OAA71458.1 hypothetical protein ISF_02009 [Cordyceps fumosorosea ARSEF 2679]
MKAPVISLPSPSLAACVCAIVDVAIAGGVVVLRAAMPVSYAAHLDAAIAAGVGSFKVEIGCGGPATPPPPQPPREKRDCADIEGAITTAEAMLRKGLRALPGFSDSGVCQTGIKNGIKAFKDVLGCEQVKASE